MPEQATSSQLRLLAPVALAVFAVAFFTVILTSGTGDESGERQATERSRTATQERAAQRRRPRRSTYTVKTGDTLGGIAEKTGVPIEKLQELNPALDPQALVSGQKIKLRE